MTLQEFKNQVLSLGFYFSKDNTEFTNGDGYYEARTHSGNAGVIWENGKYQVLINGSQVHNPRLMHKDIKKALVLAERRAECFQIVRGQQTDTYREETFNFSI